MIGVRSVGRVAKRMFSLRTKPAQLPRSTPSIPQQELVDEEISPGYNPKYSYPARPGEILSEQYQLLAKLGWGTRSTTWLAKDITRYRWQSEKLVTVKVVNTRSSEDELHELNIEKHIEKQTTSHRGRGIVRTCLEAFEVTGPEGGHLCLVYEPMREPLWILQRRFVHQIIPLRIAKAYLLILLAGLDFLHAECRLVHTDVKLENILMTFENQDILHDFVRRQTSLPMHYKADPKTGRTVYRCHNDFGPLDLKGLRKMIPKIVDLGLATRLEADSSGEGKAIGLHPIQPDHYRAPEVILGCGWDFRADIWNFGVMAWNLVERTDLFTMVHDAQGRYNARAHLAEMIALLGPPPKELLTRSNAMAQHSWPDPIMTDAGKPCTNGQEYFGGPFFDEQGNFLHDDLIPARKLEDTIPSLEGEDRSAFLDFVNQMVAWLPEERKSASQLMDHPFLIN